MGREFDGLAVTPVVDDDGNRKAGSLSIVADAVDGTKDGVFQSQPTGHALELSFASALSAQLPDAILEPEGVVGGFGHRWGVGGHGPTVGRASEGARGFWRVMGVITLIDNEPAEEGEG
jgi:hypothetical protein